MFINPSAKSKTPETGGLLEDDDDDEELEAILTEDINQSTKIELNLLEDIHDPSDYIQYANNNNANINTNANRISQSDENILNHSHSTTNNNNNKSRHRGGTGMRNHYLGEEDQQQRRDRNEHKSQSQTQTQSQPQTQSQSQSMHMTNDTNDTNDTNRRRKKNRLSQREVDKRIQSYLRESDENCKESATLVAIVVIGIIVTGSVIGFLQLGHSDVHVRHKGAHAENTHVHGEALIPDLFQWFGKKVDEIDSEVENNDIPFIDTLGIQPLYRNYLLQTIYEYSFQNAIAVDRADPVFEHVSMTYGGPWDVPLGDNNNGNGNEEVLESRESTEDNNMNNNQRRALLAIDIDIDIDTETDTETDTMETDIEEQYDDIPLISMKNGKNEHTFHFPPEGSYDSNVNEWHCYLFEFANANRFDQSEFSFRISTVLVDFEMESGFDFVRLYANSQYQGLSYTGKFDKGEPYIYRIDSDYLSQWQENDIPSFELCFNILTDESINKGGFTAVTKIEYENPNVIQWSPATDNACKTAPPNWRNPKRWSGECGIGVQTKTVLSCDTNTAAKTQTQPKKDEIINDDGNSNGDGELADADADADVRAAEATTDAAPEVLNSVLDLGVCHKDEKVVDFCQKLQCESIVNPAESFAKEKKMVYHFNGVGRVDPQFADPFMIQRSTTTVIDIANMITELTAFVDTIEAKYAAVDKRILTDAVLHHAFINDSTIRIGMKLARSLILGDTFTVAFTGSSNTAGHDNMFMTSYPMQLQSLLRPLWKQIGYKGAAFVSKNRAVGGSLNTDQMAWCIPQLTGGNAEKIDVIFWESVMNDAGSSFSRSHTMENHIRNALSMNGGTYNDNKPNRAVWHALIAGNNGAQPSSFRPPLGDKKNNKNKNKKQDPESKLLYAGWQDLMEVYSHEFGAGIVEFDPYRGMNPVKARVHAYSDDECYVTWHPGPRGHRIYAEMIATFYVHACLEVLRDVQETVDELNVNSPTMELLELLSDPPYKRGLPGKAQSKKCNPICSDAHREQQSCVSGLNPKDSVYDIQHYVVDSAQWAYKLIAGNPQPISEKVGGQASIDAKFGYVGNKDSGEIVFQLKIVGNNFLLIEKPYSDWGKLNEILKSMHTWFHVRVIERDISNDDPALLKAGDAPDKYMYRNQELKCIPNHNKAIWNSDLIAFGCVIHFDRAGKYKIGIKVDTAEQIPLLVFATY